MNATASGPKNGETTEKWPHLIGAQGPEQLQPTGLLRVPPLVPLVLSQHLAGVGHRGEEVQEWHPQDGPPKVRRAGSQQVSGQDPSCTDPLQAYAPRGGQASLQNMVQAGMPILGTGSGILYAPTANFEELAWKLRWGGGVFMSTACRKIAAGY